VVFFFVSVRYLFFLFFFLLPAWGHRYRTVARRRRRRRTYFIIAAQDPIASVPVRPVAAAWTIAYYIITCYNIRNRPNAKSIDDNTYRTYVAGCYMLIFAYHHVDITQLIILQNYNCRESVIGDYIIILCIYDSCSQCNQSCGIHAIADNI